MDEQAIVSYLLETFPGVETQQNFGYTFFFYGDERMLPFATIATQDQQGDDVSNLDRPGVFRLNIGVRRATFQNLFGSEKIDTSAYDFTTLDTLLPHPDYAAQSWLCVLRPSATTFGQVQPLLAEAYTIATERAQRKAKG